MFLSHKLPVGVIKQYKAPQLAITVIQYVTLKDIFLDLWFKKLCAIAAPGQPPNKDKVCNVFSEVLHLPYSAAFLSFAYMINAITLMTVYRPTSSRGIEFEFKRTKRTYAKLQNKIIENVFCFNLRLLFLLPFNGCPCTAHFLP